MEERPEGRAALKLWDRRSQSAQAADGPRRFLISRLSSLGDVVCSLPAASALKLGVPEAHVTWVVDERFAAIVRSCQAVDEVIAQSRIARSPIRFDAPFEAALDLQGLLKSALVIARAHAKEKVGYHWQREGAALFSRRVLPDPSSLHVVDQYVDVARAVGGKADRADFQLAPRQEALASVQSSLPPRFVVINPGSAWASKRWPPERIGRLIDMIDLPVVLIGSKGETGGAEAMAHCRARPLDLTGQTGIGELVALISCAAVHVGGDTGSTHIAAALGIPAVGLYSSTRPERTCPYGQIDRCLYDPAGLGRIEPEAVRAKVAEALA